jgi:hypothetical protein
MLSCGLGTTCFVLMSYEAGFIGDNCCVLLISRTPRLRSSVTRFPHWNAPSSDSARVPSRLVAFAPFRPLTLGRWNL